MMKALERIKVAFFRQTAKKTRQRKGGLRDTMIDQEMIHDNHSKYFALSHLVISKA